MSDDISAISLLTVNRDHTMTDYNPTLETKRLILRKITVNDAQDIFDYASDKKIDRYISWDYHKSIEDTNKYIEDVEYEVEEKDIEKLE